MIELNQLEQLVTVAACGTLSGAAERLLLSQPALTRSMQRLEEELQVKLFDRQKNKIALNKNGELAVDYARRVLEQANDMVERVRAYDRSQRTLLLGSCAPIPLWELVPIASNLYPELTIASEMRDAEELLQGLRSGVYQMIVLPQSVDDPQLLCIPYKSERLYISLPPAHPLAGYPSIHFSDIDGENILLFSQIGFWHQTAQLKMPSTRFLLQDERFTFLELVKSSALPSFTTDLVMEHSGRPENRSVIPILDAEASVNYYCVCCKDSRKGTDAFFREIEKLKNSGGKPC